MFALGDSVISYGGDVNIETNMKEISANGTLA